MSDFKLPELPSDEELGISDADRKALEEEGLKDDGPEMSAEEMAALFGEAPPPAAAAKKPPKREGPPQPAAAEASPRSGADPGAQKGAPGKPSKEEKAAAKAARAAEKKAKREAQTAEKEKAREAKAAARAEAVEEGPRSKWRGPATLAFLLIVAWFMSTRTGLPSPVSANAGDDVFSSARAMSVLVDLARSAHPPGSPEHAYVRGFVIDRLAALGLEPEVQTTTSAIQGPGIMRSATVRNVVARLPGTNSTGAILLTAHYDSREHAVGAGDDGSGVVTILETLRAIRAGPPLQNDVIVVITDAEELGLLGARGFVDEHRWMDDVQLVLSFEMRGGGGPSIMFETGDQNGWVVRALKASDPHPFANSMSFEVYQRLPNDSDFTPFKEAGKQGLNFAAIDNAHVYHQPYDAPQQLSESTLQHHGLHALGVLRYLGDQDLTTVNGPNVVFFTVPQLGLFVYDASFVMWISGGLIALLLLALASAHVSGARVSATLAGAGVAILGAALSYGAGYWLLGWTARFHPEAGSLHGAEYHSEGWYVLALAASTMAVVTGLHALSRKWLRVTELSAGAVLLPLAAAVFLGYEAPLAAMNLQWPIAGALLAILVMGLLGARAGGTLGWIVMLLLAVPVLALMVPIVELLWMAMTFRLAAVLAVLMAIMLQLTLPALDGLRHPNGWWAPVTGAVVAAAMLGMGLLSSRSNADRPAPSTLVYAYEHGSTRAVWATAPSVDSADTTAREWAVAQAGADFTLVSDLSAFGYGNGEVPTAPASPVDASPPIVIIQSDTIIGDTRRVTLGVRSQIGAERLRFQYEPNGGTRLVSLNGIAVEDPASLRWADHWGEPDPLVLLELELGTEQPIALNIIEHLLRPEELLGAEAFERPDDLSLDVIRESDRAMLLFSIANIDPRFSGQPLPEPSPEILEFLRAYEASQAADTLAVDAVRPDSTGS